MSIGRKITITEPLNVGGTTLTKMPIRKLFNVGPIIESSSILNNSNFDYSEVKELTKKKVALTTKDSDTFPTITETYEFYNSNPNLSFSGWQSFINSNLVTNVATDHYCDINALFDINDAYYLGLSQPSYIANINYEYNFLSETYENLISFPSISEKLIPNMYAIMYAKAERDVGSQQTTFNNIITLNNLVNATETYSMQTNVFSSNKPKGDYLETYTTTLSENISTINFDNISGPMTNLVIPPEQLKFVSQLNEYKELYPMYNEINLTMDKFSSFSTLLKDSGLTLSLINYVINTTASSVNLSLAQQQVSYNFISVSDVDVTARTEQLTDNKPLVANLISNVATTNVDVYNVYDWWSKTKTDFTPSETNNTNTLVFGVDDETQKISQKNYEFARSLSYMVFYGKLRKLVQQTLRNFSQTINGEPAYTETVFYRVDKLKNGSTIPTQTFWIPNDASIDTFQFVDTQVKYNTEYRYEVYSYNIIIANSISTTRQQSFNTGNSQYYSSVDYTTTPVVTLAKIPVYSMVNKILDDPPLMPEITFVANKNIDNKIKILFNNSTGEEQAVFIPLTQQEISNKKILNTMFSQIPIKYTKFKSDDIPSYFEVYRINEKPTNYLNFTTNLLTTVDTKIDSKSSTKASSATYVDSIVPNKKYYYMFRTIDFHGNVSNPTDIYEIEMVNDDGAIYLRQNIHNIKQLQISKVGSKTLKKMFFIKPEILQTFINTQLTNNMNSAYDLYTMGNPNILGTADESVWGRKFKLRFVSKKTGKMFDLNLQLNVEIDKENL